MKSNIFITACLFSMVLILGCAGSDSEVKEKRISKITNTSIELTDGTKIRLPASPADGVTTLFLVRPGQHEASENRAISSLSPEGFEYAEKLKKLFAEVELMAVLGIGTRYVSQTGQPTADSHGTKVLTYSNDDYGAFLDYIYHTEKGKKYVVIETEKKISEMLYTLSAGQRFPDYPSDVFDQLYVIKTEARGSTEIHRLKF